MSLVFRPQEGEEFLSKVDDVETEAKRKSLEVVTPTAKQRSGVLEVIRSFVKEKQRKLYGGFAQHLLLKKKGLEGIYGAEDYPDMDFFSPRAKRDAVELVHRLKGFSNVVAEEALHQNTLRIKVELEVFADVTYLPGRFYDFLPVVRAEGYCCTSPEFMSLDAYLVYTRPLENFFRLRKTYERWNLLLQHFAHETTTPTGPPRAPARGRSVADSPLFSSLAKSCVFVDAYAHNFFVREAGFPELQVEVDVLTVISTTWKETVAELSAQHGPPRFYRPFLGYVGRKAEFGGKAVVYAEKLHCVPYVPTERCRVASLQLTFLYLLAEKYKLLFDRSQGAEVTKRLRVVERMISNLVVSKKAFYEKNPSLTPFTPSPFREYVVTCVGRTVSEARRTFLLRSKRKKKRRPIVVRYSEGEDVTKFLANVPLSNWVGQEKKGQREKNQKEVRRKKKKKNKVQRKKSSR